MNSERFRPTQFAEGDPKTKILIPYQEFLKNRSAETGSVVTGVKPNDLFTYQTWIDDEKIANVLNYVASGDPQLENITGYLHFHPKFDRNVIVIGNGNHRALYALLSGRRINVELSEPNVEREENPFRINNLLKKYGNVFSSL